MIAYEIQLRYVIRDKIQSKTNSVQNKIQSKKILSGKKICQKKNSWIFSWTGFCLGLHFVSDWICLEFPVHFLSQTNGCLSSLSGIYIPQLVWACPIVNYDENDKVKLDLKAIN